MKKYLVVLSTLALLSSCKTEEKKAEVQDKSYELLGTLKNVPDSTMVVLSVDNEDIDSVYVIGEKFRFTGSVEEPTNVYLTTPGSTDYTSFWIENKRITFEAEKGNFREALITGSETEEENKILNAQVNPLLKRRDILRERLSETSVEAEQDSIITELRQLRAKETEFDKDFIRKYPGSPVSAFILNIYSTTWGKEETTEFFAPMPAERKESTTGKEIARYLELSQNPQVGDQYIDLEQANANDKMVKISEVKGKYTLIEFWASWCGPCRKTNPELVKNYSRFKDRGFEIYAISLDQKKDSWLKAIKDDGLTWTNVSDLLGYRNEAGLIYGVSGIPDNFLIDENGTIIARDLRGETFTKKLEELFGEREVTSVN